MKIEKLNIDKIRITLDINDLKNNHLDIHTFMSNSTESQNLFLNILDLAEEQIGFSTEDYKVKVETLYLNNGFFILNITRFKETLNTKVPRVKAIKKNANYDFNSCLFIFSSINDFLDFYSVLKNNFDDNILHDCKYSLYLYDNNYYMDINTGCLNIAYNNKFIKLLSEFSISNICNEKNSFNLKLKEFGKCLKHNCTF